MKQLIQIAVTFGVLIQVTACVETDATDPTDPTGSVADDPADEALAAEEEAPPAAPPTCTTGSVAGGMMIGVGWTCEINAAGSNLCCDRNRGLYCKVVPGRPPFNAECDLLVGPPPPPQEDPVSTTATAPGADAD